MFESCFIFSITLTRADTCFFRPPPRGSSMAITLTATPSSTTKSLWDCTTSLNVFSITSSMIFDTGIHESRIGWSSLEDWRVMAALSDVVSPDSVIARRTRPFNDWSRSFNVAAKSLPCCRSTNAGEGLTWCRVGVHRIFWRDALCDVVRPTTPRFLHRRRPLAPSSSSSSPISFSNQSSSDANSSGFSIKMPCPLTLTLTLTLSSHQSSSSNHSFNSGRTYKRSTFTIKKRIAHNVMAASKEDKMFSCKSREDRQLGKWQTPPKEYFAELSQTPKHRWIAVFKNSVQLWHDLQVQARVHHWHSAIFRAIQWQSTMQRLCYHRQFSLFV